MQEPAVTVLLIEDNPDFAVLVRCWLQKKDDQALILNWADTLEAGLRRIAQGGVDVILLDLGLQDSDGTVTFEMVRKQCGNVPIIVLSSADSEPLARRMIQQGAQDYLIKTACTEGLLKRALQYALIRQQSQVAAEQPEKNTRAKIIGVVGGAGGVGATTIACVIAEELRVLTDQSVLLVDMDLTGGMVPFIAGVALKHSMLDLFKSSNALDPDIWNRIVDHKDGGMDILSCPEFSSDQFVGSEDVGRFIRQVQSFYDWIVMDIGRLNPIVVNTLTLSADVLVTTTLSLGCLHQCAKTVDNLVNHGIPRENMRLIVNRRDETSKFSDKELQSLFGLEVFASLPPAAKDLHNALLHKTLPAASGAFRRALGKVARKIAILHDALPKSNSSSSNVVANRFGFSFAKHQPSGVAKVQAESRFGQEIRMLMDRFGTVHLTATSENCDHSNLDAAKLVMRNEELIAQLSMMHGIKNAYDFTLGVMENSPLRVIATNRSSWIWCALGASLPVVNLACVAVLSRKINKLSLTDVELKEIALKTCTWFIGISMVGAALFVAASPFDRRLTGLLFVSYIANIIISIWNSFKIRTLHPGVVE